jgi:hypothetical protein
MEKRSMFAAIAIGLLLVAVPSQASAQAATRCVPVRVAMDGNNPLPPSLTLALAGSGARTTAMVPLSAGPDVGVLLPTDERRVSLVSSLPPGYTLSGLTYGSTNLMTDPLRVSNDPAAALVVTLSAAPGSSARVSGRVTGVDLAARPYYVELIGGGEYRQQVAPDGSFSFAAVWRGTHRVELQSTGGIPVSMPIVVGSEPLTVEVVSPPQREVNGLVIKEGDSKGLFYFFSLIVRDGTQQKTISPTVASNGTFRIAVPVGDHQVSLSGFRAGAVQSFTYGDANLLTGPLRVSPADKSAFRITLAAGTGPSGVPGGVPYYGPSGCSIPVTQGVPAPR